MGLDKGIIADVHERQAHKARHRSLMLGRTSICEKRQQVRQAEGRQEAQGGPQFNRPVSCHLAGPGRAKKQVHPFDDKRTILNFFRQATSSFVLEVKRGLQPLEPPRARGASTLVAYLIVLLLSSLSFVLADPVSV